MKQIIQWTPRAVQKSPTKPNDWHGVFRTKVAPGTPGSIHHKGQIGATGKDYDYYGLDVTQISGKIRWIDKVLPAYTGAQTQIIILIESEKALHRVEIPYDAGNLHNVMNMVCGLGKNISEWHVNLSYWVRPKKDSNGNIQHNDKGGVKLLKTFQIADVTPQFSFEEWKDFAQKNALEWSQKKRADGKTEWVTDSALKYWDARLVATQRFLLKTHDCLPFTYGSLTACLAENPSGGGNLTADEIEAAKVIYESKKGGYKFQNSRESVDADSVVGIQAAANTESGGYEHDYSFPEMEPPAQMRSNAVQVDVPESEFSDLPF